ncbi:hypothetical protein AB4Z38_25490 [Arthrobacter sp. 2RAF6]|uniref:hypothetical protein n=1 Tax=Arthrobacter sp. 2RAF6 TaxID=3233002 RepID=UPI003F93B53C
MDDYIAWFQKFAPLIGGIVGGVIVPLGGLWIKLRSGRQDPAAVRSMKLHAKLHDTLPESTRAPIQRLIEFEAARYSAALMRKGKRKVKGGNVTAFVLIALTTGALVYACIAWGLIWWPAFIGAAIVGLFGGGLLAVGSLQLFDYGDDDEASASKANEASSRRPVDAKRS